MNLKDFIQSLNQSYMFYEGIGEAEGCNLLHSLPVNKDFNRIALDTSVPYPDVFFHGLSLQQFNFQLKDYSFFQFSFISEDDIRYAFYPSPYGFKELEEIQKLKRAFEAGIYDTETFEAFIQDININYSRSLIRYEYNVSQYQSSVHPVSHLHIGTFGEDRWIVKRKFTPLAFSLFIGKLYYSDHWESLTEFNEKNERLSNEYDQELLKEKQKCLHTPDDKFLNFEKKFFHIS